MPRVEIPPGLATFAGGQQEFELPGATVQEVLRALNEQFPELGSHLLRPDGSLRSYVNAYVNDADIRSLAQLPTPVASSDTLTLVPSIAGG